MGWRRVALGAVAAAALTLAPRAEAASDGPGCDSGLPVVAHHAGGGAAALPAGAALPSVCAVDTGYATSETSIAATNSGALFFSPVAHRELARALGRQRRQLAAHLPAEDAVHVAVEHGRPGGHGRQAHRDGCSGCARQATCERPRCWWTSPRSASQAATAVAYAHGFQVYASPDDGHNWTTADYQHENTGDWEKIFVGPPPASGPKPSGYPDVVYVCANAPFEVSGPGRDCYKSLDGGATFTLASYVFPSASSPADFCPALAGNTGVVDSAGTTYQPQSCSNGTYVAVSGDEGSSYSWQRVTGAPPSSQLFGSVQLALDGADNLYAMWVDDGGVELVISRDHAKTWSKPLQVSAPGVHQIDLPALAAGRRGRCRDHVLREHHGCGRVEQGGFDESEEADKAATSAGSAGSGDPDQADRQVGSSAPPPPLTPYVTQTTNALAADPVFYSAPLNDPAKPSFTNYAGNASPRADFIGGTYDATGTFWAGAVRQLGKPASDSSIATTGRVGRLVFHDRVGLPLEQSLRRPPQVHLQAAPRAAHARDARGRVRERQAQAGAARAQPIRVTLSRLPRGRFEVKIVATQSSGSTLTSTRVYRGCTKSRPTTRAHHR